MPLPAVGIRDGRVPVAAGGAVSWALRISGALCLLGAEVIHTAVMPAHFAEWFWAGAFFLLVSVVEGLLGAGLLVVPARPLARVAVVVSLATVAVWAVSRAQGVPFGPGAGVPEPVGRADVLCGLLELATAATLWPLARGRDPSAVSRPGRTQFLVVAGVAIVVGVLVVVACTGGSAGAHAHLAAPPAPVGRR